MVRCEEIFRQICWLEERFWPNVDGMGEQDESGRMTQAPLGSMGPTMGSMNGQPLNNGINRGMNNGMPAPPMNGVATMTGNINGPLSNNGPMSSNGPMNNNMNGPMNRNMSVNNGIQGPPMNGIGVPMRSSINGPLVPSGLSRSNSAADVDNDEEPEDGENGFGLESGGGLESVGQNS